MLNIIHLNTTLLIILTVSFKSHWRRQHLDQRRIHSLWIKFRTLKALKTSSLTPWSRFSLQENTSNKEK